MLTNYGKNELLSLMTQNDNARSGIDAILIDLKDVPQNITWMGDLPTLIPKIGLRCSKISYERSIKSIFDMTGDTFGKHIMDLLEPNGDSRFVIAGGAICNGMCYREKCHNQCERMGHGISDYDIFAVGMEPDEADARILQFVESLDEPCTIYRTPNCITMLIGKYDEAVELQFITRIYSNIAEILYGFDIAPAAAALAHIGGKFRILMTPLCAFAHKTQIFPFDLTRRRRSFESRIGKYFKSKHFGIIFGNLSKNAMNEKSFKICRLTFDKVNKVNDFTFTANIVVPSDSGTETDNAVYGSLPYHQYDDIALFNVKKLMWGNNYLVSTCSKKYKTIHAFTTEIWETCLNEDDIPCHTAFPGHSFRSQIDIDFSKIFPHDMVTYLTKLIFIKLCETSGNPKKIRSILCDPALVRECVLISIDYMIDPKDKTLKAKYHEALLEFARKITDIVYSRSMEIKPLLGWKKSDMGTCLKSTADADASASAAVAPLFEMAYIEPEVYYGKWYEPDEVLIKPAF